MFTKQYRMLIEVGAIRTENMTKAELQELEFHAADLAANYAAIMISIISGYLFVAYVA